MQIIPRRVSAQGGNDMFGIQKGKGPSMDEYIAGFSQDPSARLLDVRTPEEYRTGHIPGSINLPVDNIRSAESALPDKNAHLYVYCLSGMRSSAAAHALNKMGYRKVTNLGGIGAFRGKLER
jgi:phage shock protein E